MIETKSDFFHRYSLCTVDEIVYTLDLESSECSKSGENDGVGCGKSIGYIGSSGVTLTAIFSCKIRQRSNSFTQMGASCPS